MSPYLFDASKLLDPHLVVRESGRPMNGLSKLATGSKPIDNGNFILTPEEHPLIKGGRQAILEIWL